MTLDFLLHNLNQKYCIILLLLMYGKQAILGKQTKEI